VHGLAMQGDAALEDEIKLQHTFYFLFLFLCFETGSH
jgi:hypothetical protein